MKDEAFPVIDSILSATHLAAWVATQYGLQEVSCELLKTKMNHTYKVTAGGETYILRVYNHRYRSREEVLEEVQLLDGLRGLVRVSYPVANTRNELVAEINAPEGKRCVVLSTYAPGEKIRHLSAAQSEQIGVEMGAFHMATRSTTIRRTHYSIELLVGQAYRQLTKYIPAELPEMQAIRNSEELLLQAFGRHPLRTGVVHLDIYYDNIAIEPEGGVTLFDFDNCGQGWLVLDIGYYCMQLLFTGADKQAYEEKKAAFLRGYRSRMDVTDQELELVPYAGLAVWIYYIGLLARRYDHFGNLFLSPNYVRLVMDKVDGWMAYHGIPLPAPQVS